MILRRRVLAAAFALALLAPAGAWAAGYAIYEQSAAALGMAGAATASIDDASAVFFNPANMTRLDRRQIYVGASLLQPRTSFAGWNPSPGYGVTEEMEAQSFYPPTIYYTSKMNEKFAYGVGLNSPFGLGVEWKDPDQFTGRYIVTKADLRTLNANASAAWAFTPQFSAALGFNALFAEVELNNRTLAVLPGGGGAQVDVAKTKLDSDWTPGYGWNLALSFKADERWQFGAFYRSKVVVDVDGNADFTQIPSGNATLDAGVAASLPPDQPVKTVLRVPAMWSLGCAWKPDPAWTIEGDVNLVQWSLFKDLPIELQTTPANSKVIVENYEDAIQLRVGAEHRLETWTYRFGYYYDHWAAPAPSVSPLLPDAGRNGVTLGYGADLGADKKWTLDLYELALFAQHRTTEGVQRDGYDGEYKTFVNSFGFSLAYHF